MTDARYATIVFECDLRKFKGNVFHIKNPFGKVEILATGNQIAFLESEVEDADIKMKCLEAENKRLKKLCLRSFMSLPCCGSQHEDKQLYDLFTDFESEFGVYNNPDALDAIAALEKEVTS